ncbi:putative Glycosyl transferases group 1 [Blattamonas nauphoetae]|uniref:tRNA-queuosine alpha-mannosyltransferase n=1 Tax=Blattamonas nauphoetae TaxID=2049346 RepID=A0ABQ9YLR5_9EUKA|nr:putative Glycosyl transferases group 1 [Blattamonas nauphoetae]
MKLVVIEPFYEDSGSHKQFVEILKTIFEPILEMEVYTQRGVKFHWRIRCSSMYFAETIPQQGDTPGILLCSSVFHLAEFLGLRKDFQNWVKLIYMHENQLIYPVQHTDESDFQFGWIQIVSCQSADHVFFNSSFNMTSFLGEMSHFLKKLPDYRPSPSFLDRIRSRSSVLHYPLTPLQPQPAPPLSEDRPLRIVWNGRWEHDKNPDSLFSVLFLLKTFCEGLHQKRLVQNTQNDDTPSTATTESQSAETGEKRMKLETRQLGSTFEISILGQPFGEEPPIFTKAKSDLAAHIVQWGRLPSKQDYFDHLNTCDVILSTAVHEFFGVGVLEAVAVGCFPLCPNRLVYPELFGKEHLYNTDNQLYKRLCDLVLRPEKVRTRREEMKGIAQPYLLESMRPVYVEKIMGPMT